MPDPSAAPLVVLGSKPGAAFPRVAAPVVLAANGAVELALSYRSRYNSHIIGLVPGIELRRHEHIQQSFVKGRPDEIVIVDGEDVTALIRETLGLTEARITLLTGREVNWGLARRLGWRRLRLVATCISTRGVAHFFKEVVPDLLGKRQFVWMARSTGMNAILYALGRYPDAEQVIVAGMGLVAGGHFNKVGEFTSKTAKADQLFMPCWPKKLRPQVSTTDETMSAVGDVPLWRGETFTL